MTLTPQDIIKAAADPNNAGHKTALVFIQEAIEQLPEWDCDAADAMYESEYFQHISDNQEPVCHD